LPLPEFPCSINHLRWNFVCRLTFDGSAILQSASMIVSQGGQAELWFGREGQDSLDDAAHKGDPAPGFDPTTGRSPAAPPNALTTVTKSASQFRCAA
jgi:hypothetical protein